MNVALLCLRYILAVTALSLGFATNAIADPKYVVFDLGPQIGGYGNPYAINRAGQVVGYSGVVGSVGMATLFGTGGGADKTLGGLGGDYFSFAFGINNTGVIIGGSFTANNAAYRATLFDSTGGAGRDLGTLGGSQSEAFGINDSGQVVGYGRLSGNAVDHATLFHTSGGANIDLGTLGGSRSSALDINNNGNAVGEAQTTGNTAYRATLFSTTGGINIDMGTLGGNDSVARAVNDNGFAAGDSLIGTGSTQHAALFSLSGDAPIDLGAATGTGSIALGINNRNQVVGQFYGGSSVNGDAFIWSLLEGMLSLNELIDPTSGWSLQAAIAINDIGQIVGVGTNSAGAGHAFLLSPFTADSGQLPEPNSALLVCIALALVGATRRAKLSSAFLR